MLATDHAALAQQFLRDADRVYESGDIFQESEKLWGRCIPRRNCRDAPPRHPSPKTRRHFTVRQSYDRVDPRSMISRST